jgi:hypothetical protein
MARRRRRGDVSDTTPFEIAYAKTGSILKASRVLAFVTAWGVVRRELGRQPTVDEYAKFWREPRRTAYKHLEEFREAFDRCDWPDPVLDRMEEGAAGRLDASDLVAA